MSRAPQVYRFATADQWNRALLHRFDANPNGQLTPAARLAPHPMLVDGRAPASVVALDPRGFVFWRSGGAVSSDDVPSLLRRDDAGATVGPFEIDGALAAGVRWVVDRQWIWTFEPRAASMHRYERDSLQHDLSIAVESTVLDIAADGGGGVWALLEAPDRARHLLHVDCKGCPRGRQPLQCDRVAPLQLGAIGRGAGLRLVLLAGDGKWLIFVNPATGAIERQLDIAGLGCCWSARRMAADPRGRIALWGPQDPPSAAWMLVVLDGAGDTIDGPLQVFPDGDGVHMAVQRDAVWFGTRNGLWRLGAADQQDARESDSTFLTPVLLSPDGHPERGWLRAEVAIDLPRGAVLEAQFASTDDQRVVDRAARIALDGTRPTEQKQIAIWELLDHPPAQTVRFTVPSKADSPIAIPLNSSPDRWLWVRLQLTTPPGTPLPVIKELRVLYPDLSIAQDLPAIFRRQRGDSTLRRLIGVIEATTQGLDERIRGIGSYLDPATAPVEWLDYLARWLDLPWDDELPEGAKRRVLASAGQVLDARGTRVGVTRLLRSLAGEGAHVHVRDVTVDHAVSRVGGAGRPGGALPVLLAGASPRSATLGEHAVVGRMCVSTPVDPLALIRPTLALEIAAPPDTRRPLEPLLERILLQYIPAGVVLRIRWTRERGDGGADDGTIVLDENGPRRLGHDSALGRTTLTGRRDRLDDAGLGVGDSLQ